MTQPEHYRTRLRHRGFWLEYASMGWMTIEAAVAIASGIAASSIALIGFGLDSVIEFFAAVIVVWQLRGAVSKERETRAVRLIGATFFALAAYLAVESVTDLVTHARPEQSTPGRCRAERLGELVVGRPCRRTGHSWPGGTRRNRGMGVRGGRG